MDLVALFRLRFALTIMFRYVFPTLITGMGAVLV